MCFYDDYKEVKSIDDLNVGDLFFINETNSPNSSKEKRISKWVIISKIENKEIIIRHIYGKQILKLSDIKLKDGFLRFNVDKKNKIIFKLFYRKRYSIHNYIISKLTNLLKWIFLG